MTAHTDKRNAMARWVAVTLAKHLPATKVERLDPADWPGNVFNMEDDDGTIYTVTVSVARDQTKRLASVQ